MLDPQQRLQAIRDALLQGLNAEHVEVIDDGARHVGHAGSESGGGHYRVLVVSDRFEGLPRLAAQRLVYEALGPLMEVDIHALQIKTLTRARWRTS